MNIYTSYFGNIRKLEKAGVIPVGISLGRNKYISCQYLQYLAPKRYMLDDKWTDEEYIEMYKKDVLSKVDINILREDIRIISRNGTRDVALLCYEKPTDFCHRHIFSEWMLEQTGYEIKEFGLDKRIILGSKDPEPIQQVLF